MEKNIPSINLKECDNTKLNPINPNQYNYIINSNSILSLVDFF
jgi:hypothetical protein